jgi:hypothetical protein
MRTTYTWIFVTKTSKLTHFPIIRNKVTRKPMDTIKSHSIISSSIKRLFSVSIWHFSYIYPTTECFFNKLDAFTALRFTVTGAPPAGKFTRNLLTTQHAGNIWTFLPLFTDHRWCWKRCPSTRKYLSQLIVSLKKHMYNNPSCTYSIPDTNFHWMASANCATVLALGFDTPVCWARCFSDVLRVSVSSSPAPIPSNFSVRTRRLRVPLFWVYSPNCLSAGKSFITKFMSKSSPTLSSRSLFHVGVIQTYTLL